VAADNVEVKMKARPLGMPSLRFINTMRILIAPREAVWPYRNLGHAQTGEPTSLWAKCYEWTWQH